MQIMMTYHTCIRHCTYIDIAWMSYAVLSTASVVDGVSLHTSLQLHMI